MSKEKETDLPEEKKQAIRPEELRIGSLVKWGVHEVVIKGIHTDTVTGKNPYVYGTNLIGGMDIHQLSGIPLSPEWLERLGFKDRSGTLANRMAFGITLPGNVLELAWYVLKSDDEGIRFQTTGSGVTYDTKVTTVHGLQNLFHSLTGQELKLGGGGGC